MRIDTDGAVVVRELLTNLFRGLLHPMSMRRVSKKAGSTLR